MSGEPLLRKLVAGLDVEAVTVDFNISTNRHICRGDEAAVVSIGVLIFPSLEEFTLYDT